MGSDSTHSGSRRAALHPAVAQTGHVLRRRLSEERQRVVYHGRNSRGFEPAAEAVAFSPSAIFQRVLTPHVGAAGGLCGHRHARDMLQTARVALCGGDAAAGDVLVQPGQLGPAAPRLCRVSRRELNPHRFVEVSGALAVRGQASDPLGQPVVAGEQGAAVAEASEHLGGEERRAADVPIVPGEAARAVGEDDFEPSDCALSSMTRRPCVPAMRRISSMSQGLAEEVYGDDRPRAGDTRRRMLSGRCRKSPDPRPPCDGHAAQQRHRFGRGGVGEGRHDHLVARCEAYGHQRQDQRVGAVAARQGVAHAEVVRQFAGESPDGRPLMNADSAITERMPASISAFSSSYWP